MILNYDNKTIQIKIVYYGPAMSGKTTSIKYLFSYFGKEKELTSIESTIGRTLFFDFGVLKFEGSEWILKFLIYSATGQDFYASTRPATLRGVDGIIFILDSHIESIEYNQKSWEELKSLFGEEIFNIPIIFSLNKYDIEDDKKLDLKDLQEFIELSNFKNYSFNKTIAIKGIGVFEAFEKLISFIFPNLKLRNC
ncbi:MAG: GTP-binding protein [Promethearchaeota archaeon]